MQLRTAQRANAQKRAKKRREKLATTHLVEKKDAWIGQGHPQLTGSRSARPNLSEGGKQFFVCFISEGINWRLSTAPTLQTCSLLRRRFGCCLALQTAASVLLQPRCGGSRRDPWLYTEPYARTHGWIDYGFPSINNAGAALFTAQPQPQRISAAFCRISIFKYENVHLRVWRPQPFTAILLELTCMDQSVAQCVLDPAVKKQTSSLKFTAKEKNKTYGLLVFAWGCF